MVKPIPGKTADHVILHVEMPAKPRKRPRQTRSIMLVDALKKTGREILEKEGREALSIHRLSADAGVAVSSIYEYFPKMESLIAAIFVDYRTEARGKLIEDIHALPPSAQLIDGIILALRAGIAVQYNWSLIDPEFSVKAAQYDELVRLDLVKPDNFWSSVATPALLARFSDEIVVRNLEKAQFLVLQTLLALPRAIVFEKPEYLGEPDTPLLLARMVHAVLTAPPE